MYMYLCMYMYMYLCMYMYMYLISPYKASVPTHDIIQSVKPHEGKNWHMHGFHPLYCHYYGLDTDCN